MIVITGATGALNGATAEQLAKRVPANRIGISVRNPDKARHFADRGIRVRQASYDDPDALRASFEGADQVLIVSSSDVGADVLAQHRRAIQAAVDAGASRVLYTSTQGSAPDNPYPPLAVHAATEAFLAETGVAWTSLRNGFFGNLDVLLGPWRETGTIEMPADGPIPWVDRADSAEAAAIILAGASPFGGPVNLAPQQAVTLDDFAVYASDLTGHTIRRVVIDDEKWIADQIAKGVPGQVAEFTLTMFQASRTGYFAAGDKMLGEVLGRVPRSAAEQLSDYV